MRKFLVCFFIFIILGGTGFYFGWAQMRVPPDSFGVIRSKTHGIDENLIRPGEFRWIWYKLIPTNTKTVVFRLDMVSHDFLARNNLPSGSMYSAFAGIGEDFSWEISASFSFNLKPEAIIPLVSTHNIGTQEDLAQFEQELAGQIESFILRRMDFTEEFESQLEPLFRQGESPALERDILVQFPFIQNFSLHIKSAQIPDFSLYRQMRDLYNEYIALQKEHFYIVLSDNARNRAETRARIDELELYGDLITRFPLLLDYMVMEDNR